MSWVITGSEKTPVDPQFGSVSLLLHGNGTNGSTTITDSSLSPKTVTAVGNAQISTAIADPFGNSTGVIAFDGTGDWLTVPYSADIDFSSGPFTVEAWIYQTQNTTGYAPIFTTNGSNLSGMSFLVDSSRGLSVYYNSFRVFSTPTKYSLNAWNHIAYVRDNTGFIVVYLNGTNVGSGSASGSPSFSDIRIGANPSAPTLEVYNGYIDDLRITKGVARYTANFTPPTAPFPDI
jgi:hypothetical protein